MIEWWQKEKYLAGKQVEGDLWICLAKMMFTYRLMICDPGSVYEFYCYPYENLGRALDAFEKWDGHGDPIDGWVKHFPSERRQSA